MKVFVVVCLLFVAVQANPQFRALRARASGLGGGGTPPQLPTQNVAPAAQPAAPAQPVFSFQPQPMYQAQPMYQVQPQYQQFQQQGRYPGAPFAGFQPAQG